MVRTMVENGVQRDMTPEEDAEAEIKHLAGVAKQADYMANEHYKDARRVGYPTIGDQLDMLWHAIDAGDWTAAKVKTTDFYTKLKAVKADHPKPEGA